MALRIALIERSHFSEDFFALEVVGAPELRHFAVAVGSELLLQLFEGLDYADELRLPFDLAYDSELPFDFGVFLTVFLPHERLVALELDFKRVGLFFKLVHVNEF